MLCTSLKMISMIHYRTSSTTTQRSIWPSLWETAMQRWEKNLGKHGLGEMNNNGEKLLDICALNKLIIGGSIFAHKNIHKTTWVSPDYKSNRSHLHKQEVQENTYRMWVKQGADVASDHHLLMARFKLKLKKNRTAFMGNRIKYNMNLLREEQIQENYNVKFSNKYEALWDILEQENSIDRQWKH